MSKQLNNSVVILVPSLVRDECNMIAEIMGWGPDSFSVPLTRNGLTIEYYGLRSECDDTFIGWLRGEEELPPVVGRNPKIKAVLNSIILSVSPDKNMPEKPLVWGQQHFFQVCRENSLEIYRDMTTNDEPTEDGLTRDENDDTIESEF